MLDDAYPQVEGHCANQAGFQRLRSTTDQLAYITQTATDALSSGKAAVTLYFDLEKAFDKVSKHAVINSVRRKGFPPKFTRWLHNYLSNRRAAAQVHGVRSDYYDFNNGVPQGTVLSPLLFNCVMDDVSRAITASPNIHPAVFADDIAVLVVGDNYTEALSTAQGVISTLAAEIPLHGLQLSPSKCCYTLMGTTPAALGEHRRMELPDGTPLQHESTAKYLGVYIDACHTMTDHVDHVVTTCMRRLSILRMLAGTDWGSSGDTLRQAYLTYVYPILMYAASVYTPGLSTKNLKRLRDVHRMAALIITGCMKNTSTAKLLWESHLRDLDLDFKVAVCTDHERFRRVPHSPGYRAQLNTGNTGGSWLHQARSLVKSSKVDGRTPLLAPLHAAHPIPPWEWNLVLPRVHILATLPGLTAPKAATPKDTLRDLAEQTIQALPTCAWHVYTDGSVSNSTSRQQQGGAGAAVYSMPEGRLRKKLAWPAGLRCISYQAELVAIRESLAHLCTLVSPGETIAILTDSQSALNALLSGPQRARGSTEWDIWRWLNELAQTHDVTTHLRYIPSHVGVAGNELADKQAQIGAFRPQMEPVSLASARVVLRRHIYNDATVPRTDSVYAYRSGIGRRDCNAPTSAWRDSPA